MPQEWLDRAADAMERNLAAPTFIGEVISMPDQGYLNDIFMWLDDERLSRRSCSIRPRPCSPAKRSTGSGRPTSRSSTTRAS